MKKKVKINSWKLVILFLRYLIRVRMASIIYYTNICNFLIFQLNLIRFVAVCIGISCSLAFNFAAPFKQRGPLGFERQTHMQVEQGNASGGTKVGSLGVHFNPLPRY